MKNCSSTNTNDVVILILIFYQDNVNTVNVKRPRTKNIVYVQEDDDPHVIKSQNVSMKKDNIND